MIINGQVSDAENLRVQKSINENLKNKGLFESDNKDTAEQGVELHPPISMQDCLYVFENSAYVAKCCRILADDIIYSDITLSYNGLEEPSDKEINQLRKINDYLDDNVDELHNLAIDYYYAGWAAMEYVWGNTQFKLKQIPIHTCKIIRTSIKGEEVYLLKQQINSNTNYFKIMGETYPDNFQYYNNQKLSYASLMGGDNIYQFFSLPRWLPDYNEILTEIAISANDYKTVSNGNISSGVLNINLEPQLAKPVEYDTEGNIKQTESREDIISKELQSANGGTAVIFTESNRPLNLDYVSLSNSNQSYLSELGDKCQQSVLNDYNIPLLRLMINTEKESMNSDKSKRIWEVYLRNLETDHKPFKIFISELIMELYSLDVNVDISLPLFADMRETEIDILCKIWDNGGLTLKQYITGLADYLPVVDLSEYDFNINPDVWEYRKLDNTCDVSPDDLALIEQVEAQLNAIHS